MPIDSLPPGQFTELAAWLDTPPGCYLREWEQQQLDRVVADVFGFHALQLGFAQIDGLRSNRMPHRWLAANGPQDEAPPPPGAALHCEFDALPFPNHSLDLIVMPHSLELAGDPHQTLREVERVLMPEGRIVITGFNPASLWGMSQRLGRVRQRFGGRKPLYLPRTGEFIGYWRLRDWLRLLAFEVEGGRFGCYRPGLRSQRGLDRFGWTESVGERWWPVFGAVYFLVAVKRVRGMRLVGLKRKEAPKTKTATAVVTNRHRETTTID